MNKQLRFQLQGDLPLLTDPELSFLDEVNSVIDSKINQDDNYIPPEIMLQISAMEKNLKIIINNLKGGNYSKARFINSYPKWRKNREECIVKLIKISKSLNKDRFNCNVSKVVGHCTSFIGGALTLGAAAFMPISLDVSTPLAIAGGTTIAVGCCNTIGTSITEFVLSKRKVNKVKKLIRKDKSYFEEMSDWLNRSSELQRSLSDILNIDIVKATIDSVKEFFKRAVKIKDKHKRMRCIEKALNNIADNFLPDYISNRVVPTLAIAKCIAILVAIFLLLSNTKNRLVFDCSSLTIRSILGVASLVDESMGVLRLSSLFGSNAAVAENLAKAVTRGAIAAVGMILDVIGIAVTSTDIHRGSRSPQAQRITEAVEKLVEEAEVVEKVFNSMS